jgi:hypothetical protein
LIELYLLHIPLNQIPQIEIILQHSMRQWQIICQRLMGF